MKELIIFNEEEIREKFIKRYHEMKVIGSVDETIMPLVLDEGFIRVFNYKDFTCLILRQDMGHLCGYIEIPEDHPYYDKGYDDMDLFVHGGLTFFGDFDKFDFGIAINNIIHNKCYVGFDCAHSGDLMPIGLTMYGTYRDMTYVRNEIEYVVDQLLDVNKYGRKLKIKNIEKEL